MHFSCGGSSVVPQYHRVRPKTIPTPKIFWGSFLANRLEFQKKIVTLKFFGSFLSNGLDFRSEILSTYIHIL